MMGLFRSRNARILFNSAPTLTPLRRLGGSDGIAQVVNAFYTRVLEDPHLVGFFLHIDQPELRRKLTQTLVSLVGGPNTFAYDLRRAHAGRGITPDAYARTTGHLYAALLMFKVEADLITAIMGKVFEVAPLVIAATAEIDDTRP